MEYKRIIRVALIVAAILLIPLVLTIRDGAVEGVGWNWSPGDFLVMGTLLFIFGLAIDLVIKRFGLTFRGIASVIGIVLALLVIWAQLAVQGLSQLIAFLLS